MMISRKCGLENAFIVGMSIKDIASITEEQVDSYRRAYLDEFALLEQFPALKKVIRLDNRPKANAPSVFIKRYLAVQALNKNIPR